MSAVPLHGTTPQGFNGQPGQTAAAQDPDQEGRALLALARRLQQQGYAFTTVTPATHARVNGRPENAWATSLRDVFGWSRPFKKSLLPADLFEAMLAAGIVVPHEDGWRSSMRLSSLHGQLLLHSAFPTADPDAVFFGPDTYRYADALVQWLRQRQAPLKRAVDIGCGSGAAAILVAAAQPQAQVFGLDINEQALRVARINAALAGTANVEMRRSDLLSAVEGEFDLIAANPPYLLDASERTYRHGGGDLGEGLSVAIVREAMRRLAPGGSLVLYTGVAIVQGADLFRNRVSALLEGGALHWDYREIDPDVFGEELEQPAYCKAERIAAVLLTVTRPE